MKDLEDKILSDPINKNIFSLIRDSSSKIYLVGGYIRDLIVGIEKDDRDYVLEGYGAWDFAKRVAGVLKGTFVGLDKERDMARVVIDDRTLDFSGTSGKLIEEDLKRRDFTINSIAWSPIRRIIDQLNGIADIKSGVIRAVKKENLQEDPLRLLRAFRIGSELKMDIEPETLKIIAESSHLLPTVSGERVSSELFLLLRSPQSFIYILKASKTGILDAIFPELTRTKDIPPQGIHYLNVYEHSLEVLKQIEILFQELPGYVVNHLKEEISSTITRFSILKLGGILHDIGKPITWEINHEGKYTFNDHERVGAELVESISERLKFSNNTTENLKSIVKWHSRPLNLIKKAHTDKRTLYSLFRELDNYLIDTTIHAMADIRSMGFKKEDLRIKEILLIEVLENYKSYKIKEETTPRILRGNDIIKILNIKAGPEVGRKLEIIREAQLLGEIKTKEEAIEYLKRI
jgi:putative nucleotidyltransferase with HDIG domain